MSTGGINNKVDEESLRIKAVYRQRQLEKTAESGSFVLNMVRERERVFTSVLKKHIKNTANARFLEIGAGAGANLDFFKKMGFKPTNIYANELIEDRVKNLAVLHPDIHILPGNALNIDASLKFDLIFQSTVFTSVLDPGIRQNLADKMLELLNPGGIILWYDFRFDNPKNKNVKGIKISEISRLFKPAKMVEVHKVTLAPPIGRRVGNMYGFFNAFPFLRTHVIAVIRKNETGI